MADAWRPVATLETLQLRAELLAQTREFFSQRELLEVQTAVLATHAVTDPAIECFEVEDAGFLQSSPEFQMKRLLAAGVPSCYQIGPAFRKGEQGRWHNVEFTMLEWYRVGFTATELMSEVAELMNVLIGEHTCEMVTYRRLLQDAFGLDGWLAGTEAIAAVTQKLGFSSEASKEEQLNFLYARALEEVQHERVFITDFAPHAAALAQTRSLNGIESAERFELVVSGLEIANGYNELLDAKELNRRMDLDNRSRRMRGLSEMGKDEHLLAAMVSGLPRCAGVAIGFDRVVALAAGAQDIQSVMPFTSANA